jgi:hypothetical protein
MAARGNIRSIRRIRRNLLSEMPEDPRLCASAAGISLESSGYRRVLMLLPLRFWRGWLEHAVVNGLYFAPQEEVLVE